MNLSIFEVIVFWFFGSKFGNRFFFVIFGLVLEREGIEVMEVVGVWELV